MTTIQEIAKLCRSTEFIPGARRPANYPEDFFARFSIPTPIVQKIIDRLRSDDVYDQTRCDACTVKNTGDACSPSATACARDEDAPGYTKGHTHSHTPFHTHSRTLTHVHRGPVRGQEKGGVDHLSGPLAGMRVCLDRCTYTAYCVVHRVFPDPEHRSSALSQQASMLYVALYFNPVVLHEHKSVMREIVDKHFIDNWVIPIYMGIVADLSEEWLPYKAAKEALAMDCLQVGTVSCAARDCRLELEWRATRHADRYLLSP